MGSDTLTQVQVISRKPLVTFWNLRPDAEAPLRAWYHEVEAAAWAPPNDIKAQYGSASIVGDNRVVFNIAGNKYRLIVAILYRRCPHGGTMTDLTNHPIRSDADHAKAMGRIHTLAASDPAPGTSAG